MLAAGPDEHAFCCFMILSMGRGMVKNLVEKGNLSKPVLIQNRTVARAEKLAEALGKDKVTPVTTVEEAVKQSDIIFSCLGKYLLVFQDI